MLLIFPIFQWISSEIMCPIKFMSFNILYMVSDKTSIKYMYV